MADVKQNMPLRALFSLILSRDYGFGYVAIVYGIAIALLTLAVPISVQVLIETVANTAVVQSVVILALALFVLLMASGLLVALEVHALEVFERRLFARISGDIALRLLHANHAELERINRDDLMNRFFAVVTLQKNIPSLLANGLPLVLQAIVGFIVVSFYHPLFLVFSVVYGVLAVLVWRIVDRPAMRAAIAVSTAKFDTANWLETLSRSNGLYRSTPGFEYALEHTARVSDAYIREHRRLFRFTFTQTIGFLILYAVGSAALLGIGGWLVVRGELSLGQLVAAELILSAVFFGLSRIGIYLQMWYETGASLTKLGQIWGIPVEEPGGGDNPAEEVGSLSLSGAVVHYRGQEFRFDVDIAAGECVLIAPHESVISRMFADLLQAFRDPESGQVMLGRHSVRDFDLRELRRRVVVIDSALVPEISVVEFLRMADPDAQRARMREMLDLVGLNDIVQVLDEGLDRTLTPYGYPLSVSETVRLKIAYALLLRPRVLVLTPLVDTITHHDRARIINYLATQPDITVLCISNRRDVGGFDRYLFVAANGHEAFATLDALVEHERGLPEQVPLEDKPGPGGVPDHG